MTISPGSIARLSPKAMVVSFTLAEKPPANVTAPPLADSVMSVENSTVTSIASENTISNVDSDPLSIEADTIVGKGSAHICTAVQSVSSVPLNPVGVIV